MTERIFQVIPTSLSQSTLEEYGVSVSDEQTEHIAREILTLSLFWIGCALRVSLKEAQHQEIFDDLCECIREQWEETFALPESGVDDFFDSLPQARATYLQMTRGGAEPVEVLQHATDLLEARGMIRAEERQNALALLIDFVPVDEVGEVIGEIEEELG